jgi:hypothetical protein
MIKKCNIYSNETRVTYWKQTSTNPNLRPITPHKTHLSCAQLRKGFIFFMLGQKKDPISHELR